MANRHERRTAKIVAKIMKLFGRTPDPVPEGPEIDVFFADDARQRDARRPGMEGRDLLATGGMSLGAEEVGPLTRSIDALCAEFGFPPNEEFKWSPPPTAWMHDNLVSDRREEFYRRLFELVGAAGARVTVIVADTSYKPAVRGVSHDRAVSQLFLERVSNQCSRGGSHGFVIADRPGGGATADTTFLAECLELIQSGAGYVKAERIAHNVLSTPSKLSRGLQVADVVTSCTAAMVAGTKYAPPVFDRIRPLFESDGRRIGGVGLKIHPDFRYVNLYHWLVGDTHFVRAGTGNPLPLTSRPYSKGPLIY